MGDFFLQQYNDWKKNQNNIAKEQQTENYHYYRFVYGDLAPKQAYNSYSKYIQPHIISEYLENANNQMLINYE